MRINYNVPANLANNKLNFNNDKLANSIQRLSSGLKINSAADDAAGLSIAKKMNAQIRCLKQANNNAEDGVSVVNTIDGAMGEIQDILQRMNELCIQSANGTNATSDRNYIQTEIEQMVKEIDRIADTTQFNAQNLLDGTFALKGFSNSENVTVFAYSDYVDTGKYTIDTLTYSFSVNKITDSENNETIKEKYEVKNTDNIKANLGSEFPDACRVTAEDDVITITGDNNFEIQIAVNNRTPLLSTPTAPLTTTDTVVKEYKTEEYSNVSIIDESSNVRYNLSELNIKTGIMPTVDAKVESDNFYDLTEELTKAGAIDAPKKVQDVVYDKNPANPTIEIKLDDGSSKTYKLDYSLQEKLAQVGNYKEDEIRYEDAGTSYHVIVNGSTVTYDVDKTDIKNPIDDYLKKTTETKETTYTVGKDGDTADSLSINITNMGGMRLQVGANEGQVIEVTIPSLNTKYMGVDDLDLTTEDDATKGIDKVTGAINYVNKIRAKIGAYENRLEHTITNLDTTEENITSAYSRIMDVDMSEEMVTYSTYNILVQSSTSMLSHANEAPSSVLQLLNK